MLLSSKHRRTDDEIPDDDYPSSKSVVVSNVDLLIQILSCLPVKSLLVFKLVSKQWLSLISDPSFIHKHYLRNNLSTHGLILEKQVFLNDPVEYEFVSLDRSKITNDDPFNTFTFLDNPIGITIEQSCNGLLLCFSTTSNIFDQKTYYIYNPSTKHYRLLRLSQVKSKDRARVCSVSLAFDPLISPYYEVICIWEMKPPSKYEIEIYSSQTDSWRLSKDAFPEKLFFVQGSGVFWNGSLHWYHFRGLTDMLGVYFDVGKGIIGKMPFPSIPDEFRLTREIKYFGECRGHLHLVISYDGFTNLGVFEIDTDYIGWNTKYCVDLKGLLIAYPKIVPGSFGFSLVLVKEDKDSSKLILEILNNSVIISYDLKGFSFEKIHKLSLNSGCLAYQYIETLACV